MKLVVVLGFALAIGSCERERRTFSQPLDQGSPATLEPRVSLYAGEAPAMGTPLDLAMPGYAETAFNVSEGHTLYSMFNCVGCHARGGGAMGPALMDSEWKYGSSPSEIATSIIAGRPEGMPSFRGKIAPQQLYQLVAYVRSIGNLVRTDAVPARDDHLRAVPPPTLENEAVPMPGKERP